MIQKLLVWARTPSPAASGGAGMGLKGLNTQNPLMLTQGRAWCFPKKSGDGAFSRLETAKQNSAHQNSSPQHSPKAEVGKALLQWLSLQELDFRRLGGMNFGSRLGLDFRKLGGMRGNEFGSEFLSSASRVSPTQKSQILSPKPAHLSADKSWEDLFLGTFPSPFFHFVWELKRKEKFWRRYQEILLDNSGA